jgi:TatD DNase family protein
MAPTGDDFDGFGSGAPIAQAAASATGNDRKAIEETEVELRVVLGTATLRVRDILKLGRGAVVELDRSITIHCLRAFGLLEEVLRSMKLPRRGFLLHSYGGPAEMVPGFMRLGGYFSVSPYFTHPRKAAQLATFAKIPLERLLAETDAPDMWPPPELNPHPLPSADVNHPFNLSVSYDLIAAQHEISREEAEMVVAGNYQRLFDDLGA